MSVSPVVRVMLLALLLLAAGGVLTAATPDPLTRSMDSPWLAIPIIGIGFALCERYIFYIEYRRDAITFSASEVPAALALAFLSPVLAIVVRVVFSVGMIRMTSKPANYKFAFNAGLFSFEMALAFFLVRLVSGVQPDNVSVFLPAVAVALAVSTLAGSVMVSLAIACFEGRLGQRLVDELRMAGLSAPVTALSGATVLALAMFQFGLFVIGIVPVVAVWLFFQQYGRLAQEHRDLEALHGFAGVIGRSLDPHVVASVAVREITRLLRADHGSVQLYSDDGEVILPLRQSDDADMPTHRDDVRWKRVFEGAGAMVAEIGQNGPGRVGREAHRGRLTAPIRDSEGVLGLLVVHSRSGAVEEFQTSDLARANTLVEHLATVLRNCYLHAGMEHAALHDALTGDFNRVAFERAINRISNDLTAGCTAVLMLDLNRFKEVNDTLGHHVGDRVLIEFSRRIVRQLTESDVSARFGGDEFAVLVRRDDLSQVMDVADRLLTDSFAPMNLDGLDVVVTVSVGIALIEHGNQTAADVLRQADIAMYSGKRSHTAIELYRPDIDRRTPERLVLLSSVRDAMSKHEIEVHYQPKVDLRTSKVIGAEALIRWNPGGTGWVPPTDIVRVAEESGLIKALTDYVLTAAIAEARGWIDDGFDLGVAVNLSAHDLLDGHLPRRIQSLLDEHGVGADRLTLEITESALLADTPRTMSTVNRLSRMGARLSLDDFGTGYSSLGYLRRLPVRELKVDQSFVQNLLLDEQDGVIVRSTIDLGHNLGLVVVAEGIESMPILDRLTMLGCDIGQGYGISRALSPSRFRTWLLNHQQAGRGIHI